MKKTLLILIIFLLALVSNSQNRKIERIYSNCYFNAMPENGKKIKTLYKNYEKLLISKEVLDDRSGKSYYKLLERIINENFYDTITNYSLIDSINKLGYIELIHSNSKCTEKIKSLKEYKNSNSFLLEKRMDSIKDNITPNKTSEIILKTLSRKDFKIEYYKLRVLLLLNFNKSFAEIEKPIYSEKRIENSLNIFISEKNLLFINGSETSRTEFENIIINYLLKFKKESLISIHSDRNTLYKDYIKLIDNINLIFNNLKNEISMNRFGKSYNELTDEEKTIIDAEYSFEIYEKEP